MGIKEKSGMKRGIVLIMYGGVGGGMNSISTPNPLPAQALSQP